MAKDSKEAAEAQSRKAQKAQEGEQAMAQYKAEAQAVRDKTERLRALRLAKEAADQKSAPVKAGKKAPAGAKKAPAGAKKAPAGTKKKSAKSKDKGVPLSDWLSSEQGSGRRG